MTKTAQGIRYGELLTWAMERARTVTSTSVPVSVRQNEIIDLCLQGLTVPQMRALYVAHFSGQMMPRGWKRAQVAAELKAKIMAALKED